MIIEYTGGIDKFVTSNQTMVIVDSVPPTVPAIVYPQKNSTVYTKPIKFYWTEAQDETGVTYTIKISTEEKFGTVVYSTSVETTTFSWSPMENNGSYTWCGRVWAPINFIVYEGLKNYDICLAEQLGEKSFELLYTEWQRHGHIHENISASTGIGEPQDGMYARSCPFYTWGGLLGIYKFEQEL